MFIEFSLSNELGQQIKKRLDADAKLFPGSAPAINALFTDQLGVIRANLFEVENTAKGDMILRPSAALLAFIEIAEKVR